MRSVYNQIKEADAQEDECEDWDEDVPEDIVRLWDIKRILESDGIWGTPEAVGAADEVAALMCKLRRVQDAWQRFQSRRRRDAVYGYLEAVFKVVRRWLAQGTARRNARWCLWLSQKDPPENPEPFAAVIASSSDDRDDRRTRSKWSRALRYAAKFKPRSISVKSFIQKEGGLNACATQYARRLGRQTANTREWQPPLRH